MPAIRIAGAGPAGTAAAISALGHGASIELYDPSPVPRHKVCGEFLSPEILPVLERLGVLERFRAARPARMERFALDFGARRKEARLPESGWGLSRYALDCMLREAAIAAGAQFRRERAASAQVIATGRPGIAPPGERLFGFKAHFSGPVSDAVELYFFSGAYVGVNPVEDSTTNVCGLAPERLLRSRGFDLDSLPALCAPLAERIRPLERKTKWFMTAPVALGPCRDAARDSYAAGDALGFVDPFTGSGILNALMTGSLAGEAAALGAPVEAYRSRVARMTHRPFAVASVFRSAVASGWAERLVGIVPARWLFEFTRPQRRFLSA